MTKRQLNQLQHCFKHFSYRLSERYKMLITFDEHITLCSYPYIRKSRLYNKDTLIGEIYIHGIVVRVLRRRHGIKQLLTALPPENKY